MKLTIGYATMKRDKLPWQGEINGWVQKSSGYVKVSEHYNPEYDNDGVVGSYQSIYKDTPETDILCYLHDDLICRENGWDERVRIEFDDSKVAIVGFGGAVRHGTEDLYKSPYTVQQLRRGQYLSNVDDAEIHGQRFAGSCRVAVLDGFSLCIRRRFLDRIGGWNLLIQNSIDFFCYDYAICALARRLGYHIRIVGVRCHHIGGQTSVAMNVDRQAEYDRSHRWFYEEFKDVMPASV